MTYTEAVARIRELSRVTDLSVSDATLELYYDEALDRIAEDVGGFYYEADVPVAAVTGTDEPPALVSDPLLKEAHRCWWKADAETEFSGIWEGSFFDLPDAGRPSTPRRWAQYEDDIYIYPPPHEAGTLRIRGLAWRYHGDETWPSPELQLPRALHMAAVHRTVSFLCDTNDDFERSNRHLGLYREALGRYRLQRNNENSDIGFSTSRYSPFVMGEVVGLAGPDYSSGGGVGPFPRVN